MTREEEAVAQTFRDYIQAFQSLRASAVPSYFQLPFMLIADNGVRALTDAASLEAFVGQLMEGLKSRDFARSEITDMRVHRLSEKLALVSVHRIRYKDDGGELERLGETYTFRRLDDGWKIAAAIVHDPGVVLTLA
jgi:ketosteroid isomerase-like protein